MTHALKNKDRIYFRLEVEGKVDGMATPRSWRRAGASQVKIRMMCVPGRGRSKSEGLESRKGLMNCRHWALVGEMGQVAYQMIGLWGRAFETMVNMRVVPRF